MAEPVKKTEAEIIDEIAALEAIQHKVLPVSMFGDDHRAAIRAQVVVLQHRMTEKTAADVWGEDYQSYLRDNALEAAAWLIGQSESASLVEEWQSLVM